MKIHIRLPGGGDIRFEREPLDSDSWFYLLMIFVVLGVLGVLLGACIIFR